MTERALPRVVLLDRDGVLNEDRTDYVKSVAEWVWLPGAREAVARLHAAGIRVAVLTNQSCVNKGIVALETLEAVHRRMHGEAETAGGRISAVFHCPHVDADACDCRKPLPGMIHQAAAHFGVDAREIPFVGDAGRDLEAAAAAGARPVLVRTGKGRDTEQGALPPGTLVFDDLPAYTEALLDSSREEPAC
ncbi:D-glycero-beta-D-manno-heptose 1,7-bisphosphate 7-phosphatase [Thiohalorhabdus methylotrophus]|uniref:D,D-heptose 1,7-bisphosphate phosphatase n=1 Tax=Thiohalorhabdus methylotrophus TaxID=3242694 RepID=A0ABV4TUV3_9GAMM